MEEKQLEFVRSLYGKYGIQDEEKINYAANAFNQDFDSALSAFYQKYNPEKEIDQEYFNQIKSSYFQPTPIEAVQPIDEAPSGFFANMKNHLDNLPEAGANMFWSAMSFIDRGGDAIDQSIYDLTGVNMKFDQSILPEQRETGNRLHPATQQIYENIKANEASMLPTKGILDEGATIPERLSGVAGVTLDFARSIIGGAVSGGALPMFEMADGAYRDALEAKAESTGVSPLQLMIKNEDEELEPLLWGAVQAGLERVGLKGVDDYINALPRDAKANALKFMYTNLKEGGTEWAQDFANKINTESASGKDFGSSVAGAIEQGFSREGAETFVGGFLGAGGVGLAGRAIKNAISPKDSPETDLSVSPEEAVTQDMSRMAPVVSAMETVETGDPKMDQLVNNVLREVDQELESKKLEEEVAKRAESAEVATVQAPVDPVAAQPVDPLLEQKEAASDVVNQNVAKDVSRTVRDKETLKKALYQFTGTSESDREAVDEVNTWANLFDGIIGARSKREGISKREWYLSRFAPIEGTASGKAGSKTTFLEDGRAIITALGKPDARSFFQEFSKVLQNDLNDTEASALEAEFGINFKKDLSEESFSQFGRAFESYLETGKVPDNIKGNTAQFVRAAFGKIAQWIRDIKSNISGDSSVYVNSNVRKIFDSIVTGKEIEAIQDKDANSGTEVKVGEDVRTDGTIVGAGETVTGQSSAAGAEVIDLTDTQEEIKQTETKDEQKTEKAGKQDIQRPSKKEGSRPQTDAATRRRNAFRDAEKDFKVRPTGVISGGDQSLKKAIIQMQNIASDPEQGELVRDKARAKMLELMDIEAEANRTKQAVAERSSRVKDVKDKAKSEGFTAKGVDKLFEKKNIVPLEYDNGYISYLDTETGEINEYSLSKESSSKTTVRDFQSDESKKKRKEESEDRAVQKAVDAQIAEEKKNRAKQDKAEQDRIDKEADKANDVYFDMEDPTVSSVQKTINKIPEIDFETAKKASRQGDVSKKEVAKEFTKFINSFLSGFTNIKTSREFNSLKKKFDSVYEDLLKFVKSTDLLSEKQRTELIEELEKTAALMNSLSEEFGGMQEKKSVDKMIGGTRNTVFDQSKDIVVQVEGFDKSSNVKGVGNGEEFGKKLSGLFKDLLRGFGMKRKIILFDKFYFINDNHPDFAGLDAAGIKSKREEVINRLAASMYKDQLILGEDTSEYQKISFSNIKESIESGIKNNSNGFAITGSDRSLIVVDSSRPDSLVTSIHEFGHVVESELLTSANEETLYAIHKDYVEWLDKKSKKYKKDKTFHRTGELGLFPVDEDFFRYASSYSEYVAEQISYWIQTNEKPSSIVEKFFLDVANKLKKIFLKYKEEFGVSESLQKFLNDQFYLDKERASSAEKDARERAADSASKKYVSIMENNRTVADIKANMKDKPYIPSGTKDEDIKDFVAEFFADKKRSRAKIAQIEAENAAKLEEVQYDYKKYSDNGGSMTFEEFNAKASAKGEELLTEKTTKAALKAIHGGYDADSPAVDFHKSPSNPRAGDKRKILLDRLSTAVDGKFNSLSEFSALMNNINKSLKKAGEPVLSSTEKKTILSNTQSGSIALVSSPIYKAIAKKGSTQEFVDVIKSFSASRQERDNALAESDAMIKAGGPLTPEDHDKFNKLQLVGLYNTTVAEREGLIKDNVAKSIAEKELSRINQRVEERTNEDRLTIADAMYESVLGFKKISDGVYRAVIKGFNSNKAFDLNIYDRNKVYRKGDMVEYGGTLYQVTDHVNKFESGFTKKMKPLGTINTHKTGADLYKKSRLKSISESINNLFIGVHGIESLADIVSKNKSEGSFEGSLSRMIGESGFRKAARNQREHRFEVEKRYMQLGEKIFGVKGMTKVNEVLYKKRAEIRKIKFTDNNSKPVEVNMTVGEMMTWYAYMGQPDLVAKFETMEKKWGHIPGDARFWNKSKQDSIIDTLSQQEKDFVSGIVTDVMPYVYDTLNKAHRRELGYDMQVVPNYFPTKVEVTEEEKRQNSVIDTGSVDYSNFISSIGNNSIKDRRSNNPLVAKDFFAQFLQYSEKAIHYAEYVGPLKRASLLFQNHKYEYAGFFNSVFGKDIMKQIKTNLDNIAFGAPANYNRNKFLDMIRSLGISGAFMANPTMLVKQMASFIAMASDISWRDFTKYYVTTTPKEALKDIKEIMDMNFFKERAAQHGRVNYDTYGLAYDSLEKEINKIPAQRSFEQARSVINKWLFAPLMAGDLGAVIVGGAPYLHSLKQQAKKKFPNNASAQKEWVEIKFEEKVSRTQQSRDIMDQSDWQTAGSFASWMTTFMSTPILYGRLLSGALRDMRNGIKRKDKGLFKKGLKTGVMFSTIAPIMFQVASTGGELVLDSFGFGDDEEEDQLKAWKYNIAQIGSAFFQHMPIVYPSIQWLIDKFTRDSTFDVSISAPEQIYTKGLEGFANIADDLSKDDFDFNDPSTQRDINALSRAVGVNYNGIVNLASNWSEFATEGTVEDYRLLLGYSEYAVK